MPGPELGKKRTCINCSARFYDLNRVPILCPKCGFEHQADSFVKVRRGRAAAPVAAAKAAVVADKVMAAAGEDEDLDLDAVALESEDTDDVLEDASELGTDNRRRGRHHSQSGQCGQRRAGPAEREHDAELLGKEGADRAAPTLSMQSSSADRPAGNRADRATRSTRRAARADASPTAARPCAA